MSTIRVKVINKWQTGLKTINASLTVYDPLERLFFLGMNLHAGVASKFLILKTVTFNFFVTGSMLLCIKRLCLFENSFVVINVI